MAQRGDALLLAAIVGLSAFALWRLPTGLLPLWFGYLGAGGALVWVDFKTTWLPKRLHWIAAAQLAAGLALVGWLAPSAAVIGTLLGSAATAGMLWLVWRFSRTFGFGDVRLGVLVGAVAGSLGLQGWTTALLASTGIGAIWAIAHAAQGRAAEPFPYGPALWMGPLVAALFVA